jgi:FkbM family methyltransferase
MHEWRKNLISDEQLNYKILENREQIIIYGLGFRGCLLLQLLRENGIMPIAVCDASPSLQGNTIAGSIVVAPDDLAQEPKSALVLVTPEHYTAQITRVLTALGFRKFLYSDNGVVALKIAKEFGEISNETKQQLLAESKSKMHFVCSCLKDDKSRAIFDARIEFEFNGNYEELERYYEPDQYFASGIVELDENEVFVDCGGCTGDTAEEFARWSNNKYKRIYTFEPDEICYYAAKAYIHGKRLRNVTLLKLGAGRDKGEARFSSIVNGASNINEQGDAVIQIDSIDNLLYDKEHVTYIKMDVEGAEMDALIGASKVIGRDKPKLAISLYHKIGDFYEIPYYLMNAYEGYDYYIRQHSNNSETVLYAIPQK